MVAAIDVPTPCLYLAGERRPDTTAVPRRSATLLYGLSLAVALPPAAWRPPSHAIVPAIRQTSVPFLDATAIQKALGRSAVEVGRGRISLGEIDRRLHGLSLTLELFRAGAGRGALIACGLVRPERAAAGPAAARPTDLWDLALAAIPWYGQMRPWRPFAGADAILVSYGQETSQAAWLGTDVLATVGVTCLDGCPEQAVGFTYACARALFTRLAADPRGY